MWLRHRRLLRRRLAADTKADANAFPRCNKTAQTHPNPASAARNKWLKPRVPAKGAVHSFRHFMRDRMRDVACPAEFVDQIGGWQTEGVGQGYGKGYLQEVLAKWKANECCIAAAPCSPPALSKVKSEPFQRRGGGGGARSLT